MKDLKIGDRVAVYGRVGRVSMPPTDNFGCSMDRSVGTVTLYSPNELVEIKIDVCRYTAHPKQCRRLVKRKPKYYWINTYADRISAHLSEEEAHACSAPTRISFLKLKVVERKETK